MESPFFGGAKQTFTQDFFGWIIGELEIVDASVDAWIASCTCIYLSDDCQARMEIGKATRRQRTASSRKLQKCFSLLATHVHQDVNKANESGAEMKESSLMSLH